MKEIEGLALLADEVGCCSLLSLSRKGEEPSFKVVINQLPQLVLLG